MHRWIALVAIAGAAVVALGGLTAFGDSHAAARAQGSACHRGFVRGTINGKKVCLKAGKRCQSKFDTQYHRYGFHCHASGRLTRRGSAPAPTILPLRVSVTKRSSLDAPGYIFVAPKQGPSGPGAEIVDDFGRPVWFNRTSSEADDFRTQRYNGQPVLTWWQGSSIGGGLSGVDYVLDASYHVIASLHAGNGLNADGHEFVLTPQGTALITIYHDVPYDLSSVGGPSNGEATDAVVQEINVATGQVVFEWHSLDHVPITDSYLPVDSPYDYFHINAVNLDSDGNLLISGRHTWTVYKVDRQTGQVVWRLGGRRSTFALGPGVAFAWQHNPLPAGDNTIRLFDNETDGTNRVSLHSRVIWVHLDTANWTATLVKAIEHPSGLSVPSQGNSQALDNGDTFVGWGQLGRFSEFGAQGQLLFDAAFPGRDQTYRAYRLPWTGEPDTQPTASAWTNANGTTTVHAVWNGATQVASWRVLAGPRTNALVQVKTARWSGLDTTIKIRGVPREVEVEGLNSSGSVLAVSKAVSAG